MTPTQTPFAGFEVLGPGDPFSSDGFAFQQRNPVLADRLARIGAVSHRHDEHAALANPALAVALSTAATGGTLPAGRALHVCYTLLDADGGETLPSAVATITTPGGYATPSAAPTLTADYTAGALLAGDYSFAITVTDGAGGETLIGPPARINIPLGHANAQIHVGALIAALNSSSGGAVGAGWRLWRKQGGGPWYLIGTGATDTLLDSGLAGDCTVQPPRTPTVAGTAVLGVTVPGGQPAGAVNFAIYLSPDGTFKSPSLLGLYPIADAGTTKTYTSLALLAGQPPAVSGSYPGAHKIDPSTELLDWTFKQAVANAAALPSVGNTNGDVRITLDDHHIHIWDDAGTVWIDPTITKATQQAADHAFVIADASTTVEGTSTTVTQTFTVPPHATEAIPVGARIRVHQDGTQPITIAAGSGAVNLRSRGGLLSTNGQYAVIELWQRAVDEWVVTGDRV